MTTQLAAPGAGAEAVDALGGPVDVRDRRTGHVVVRGPGDGSGSAAGGVLVADSLLLTSRAVVGSHREAETTVVEVGPVRPRNGRVPSTRPVALAPERVFVTSPALGWTLVAIRGHGLGVRRLARVDGLRLPGRGGRARWITRQQLVADLRPRLRVLGGTGTRVADELGI